MRGAPPVVAFLLASCLLGALAPPVGAGDRPPEVPADGPLFDIDPWFVGDTWTYETRTLTRSPDGNHTEATLTLVTRVASVSTESVNATTYTVYNATTNGTLAVTGEILIPSIGLRPLSLAGSVAGWVWNDRSDLAIVRTNQTAVVNGTVDMPFPFSDATMDVDAAMTVTFSPAQEDFDFPLELGDAWSYNVSVATVGYAHLRLDIPGFPGFPIDRVLPIDAASRNVTSFWFNATEDVTVPAGTFVGAPRIQTAAAGGATSDRWHHPDAKNLVKTESHDVSAPDNYTHVWVNLTAFSLSPAPWPGSIVLNPSRVNPGAWVNASGTANPDEDLRVWIPASGSENLTRSGPTGAWSVRIRAPSDDDFSPANTDVGSHGVLVEPVGGGGWEVATVRLVLPGPGPTTTILWGAPAVLDADLYVRSSTAFTFSVQDRSGSGTATWYRIDASPPIPFTAPFTLAGEGSHTIEYWSVDNLGGVEAPQNLSAFVDDTPPTTVFSVGAPNRTAAGSTYVRGTTPLAVTSLDSGVSPVGLGVAEVRVDGGAWTPAPTPFVLTGSDGPKLVEYRGRDRLGNEEASRSVPLVLDNAPPTTTAECRAAAGRTTVTLNASDAFSGVASVNYSLDGGPWQPYEGPFMVTGSGSHNLTFYATDLLGNVEPLRTREWIAPAPPSPNVKPLVAVLFAAILLVLAWLRKRKVPGGSKSVLLVALAFAAAELATGIASLAVETLAVPRSSLGLAVDVIILAAGIAAVLLLGRRPRAKEAARDGNADESPPAETQETEVTGGN